MCTKTPAVAYYINKMKTTARSRIKEQLQDAPVSRTDRSFLLDIYDGLTYEELAEKFNKTKSGIAQWKRRLCERMLRFDLAEKARKAQDAKR